MSETDPVVTLEFLAARLAEVEEQAARQATWTLLGTLGVLALVLLLFGAASLDTARAQHRSAFLLRVCAVDAGRAAESRVAYCEQAIRGFRLARAVPAADAAADDSLREWAQAKGWAPPPTTTLYPDPPE